MTAPRVTKAHTAALAAKQAAAGGPLYCRIPLAHVSCVKAWPRQPNEPYRCGATPEEHARCRWCDHGSAAHIKAGLFWPGKGTRNA